MRECTSTVTAADGNVIRLDQTVFFPTGGGQSCDLGTIGGMEVVEVFEEGEEVFHRLAEGCTLEAGQAGLGDCFDWFVKNCVPGRYEAEAKEKGISVHTLLQEKVSAQRPGESRLVALDWLNGNRSILKNDGLSGLILGLNLQTKPEEIYRALLEATAYGLRVILDNYEAHGVHIHEICAAGGIAMKSPFLMQIYADVLNRPIVVGDSAQSGARGSAMYAAVAAGKFATIQEAAAHYARPNKGSYAPIPENVELYEKLYQEYKLLHDHFGRGGNAVMDRLYDIYNMGI